MRSKSCGFPNAVILIAAKPSLAAATPTGKLVLHSPHQNAAFSADDRDVTGAVRQLKINNRVTAIATSCLDPSSSSTPVKLVITGRRTIWQRYVSSTRRTSFSGVTIKIITETFNLTMWMRFV